ncbi:MAG: hypothetical protein ACI8ZB_004126 [Desulforhopalus sp.]|jgi:hypothetical protein
MQTFEEAFKSGGNTVDNESWRTLVEFKEASIKSMVEKYGFYDLIKIPIVSGYISKMRKWYLPTCSLKNELLCLLRDVGIASDFFGMY